MIREKTTAQAVCQYGIIGLVAINVLLELMQWYRSGIRYFQWTNLFDWVVYILSFILVFDIKTYSPQTGLREVSGVHVS